MGTTQEEGGRRTIQIFFFFFCPFFMVAWGGAKVSFALPLNDFL